MKRNTIILIIGIAAIVVLLGVGGMYLLVLGFSPFLLILAGGHGNDVSGDVHLVMFICVVSGIVAAGLIACLSICLAGMKSKRRMFDWFPALTLLFALTATAFQWSFVGFTELNWNSFLFIYLPGPLAAAAAGAVCFRQKPLPAPSGQAAHYPPPSWNGSPYAGGTQPPNAGAYQPPSWNGSPYAGGTQPPNAGPYQPPDWNGSPYAGGTQSTPNVGAYQSPANGVGAANALGEPRAVDPFAAAPQPSYIPPMYAPPLYPGVRTANKPGLRYRVVVILFCALVFTGANYIIAMTADAFPLWETQVALLLGFVAPLLLMLMYLLRKYTVAVPVLTLGSIAFFVYRTVYYGVWYYQSSHCYRNDEDISVMTLYALVGIILLAVALFLYIKDLKTTRR